MSRAVSGATDPRPAARATRSWSTGLTGLVLLGVLVVAGLLWAKWLPYTGRITELAGTRTWSGTSIFGSAGSPGAAPSLAGAWRFTLDYVAAVWRAAVVAVVVAAALESLVPRAWLARVLSRPTRVGQGAAAGLVSLPSMMCTCCTAPVAVGMRRRGVPLGAALAYWIGNPLLNPAVVVFLALTLPWQLAVTRVAAGVLLVVGGTAVVSAWVERGRRTARPGPDALVAGLGDAGSDPRSWGEVAVRFARSLLRLCLVLVPEYLAAVFVLGLVSGWLSDFTALGTHAGPLALLLVAVVGTALVVPTGGEVPVLVALTAAGAGAGVVGVLLVALPALSLPSVLMVARTFSWRATASLSALVVLTSVLAGGVLAAVA